MTQVLNGVPKFKGKVSRDTLKQRDRKPHIHESRKNAGGFYEDMPGVTLDKHGNRVMLSFIVQPDGYGNAFIGAHPLTCKAAMKDVMTHNPMIKAIAEGAVFSTIVSSKNPLNWPLKLRIYFTLWYQAKRKIWSEKKRAKAEAKKATQNG